MVEILVESILHFIFLRFLFLNFFFFFFIFYLRNSLNKFEYVKIFSFF